MFSVSLVSGIVLGLNVLAGLQAATTEQAETIFRMIKRGVVLIGVLGLLTALAFCLKRSE